MQDIYPIVGPNRFPLDLFRRSSDQHDTEIPVWKLIFWSWSLLLLGAILFPRAPDPAVTHLLAGRVHFNPMVLFPASSSMMDIGVNLFAFFVLGLLYERTRQAALNKVSLTILSMGLGLAFSGFGECLQQIIPGRVSSGMDIFVDTVGTAAGAWLSRTVWAWSNLLRSPTGTIVPLLGMPTILYFFGVLLYGVWPFSIRTTVTELAGGFRDSQFMPDMQYLQLFTIPVAIEILSIFAPLGMLLVLNGHSLYSASVLGVFLVGAIEASQVLVEQHVASSTQWIVGVMAVIAGAAGTHIGKRIYGVVRS